MAESDFIEWSERFSVGIPSIDLQHRRLVDLLNRLQQAVATDQTTEVLQDIFDELLHYTVDHFGYEEKLLEEYGYPGTEKHQRQHAVLRKQVQTLRERHLNGELIFSDALVDFLKSWLKEHIQGSDREYGPFLQSHGVQ